MGTLKARVPAVLKEDLRARESGSLGDIWKSSLAQSCPDDLDFQLLLPGATMPSDASPQAGVNFSVTCIVFDKSIEI